MPVAVARAASAPSSRRMRSSNMATVGLAKREVDEAGVLVLEARLGLLGGVVDEALGEEQRLGGLAERRAQGAAVHEPRLGLPGCRIGRAAAVLVVMRALLAGAPDRRQQKTRLSLRRMIAGRLSSPGPRAAF